jgi:hypothetical protein
MSPFRYLMRSAWIVLRRPKMRRDASSVTQEYSAGWSAYLAHIEKARSLDEWLRIPGVEDGPRFCNVEGRLEYQAFDSMGYYRGALLRAIERHFPQARSVTEFGAGLGRNLLFLKRARPALDIYGYELCAPGVEVGNAGAARFGIEARYAQLDYLRDPPEKFVFPQTDIAFTMFSLEQLPQGADVALRNILARTTLGSIHIEPVPENYPFTVRGLLGRIDHWKVDYLTGFDRAARGLGLKEVIHERLDSAHNPLMFPSVYVLKKA